MTGIQTLDNLYSMKEVDSQHTHQSGSVREGSKYSRTQTVPTTKRVRMTLPHVGVAKEDAVILLSTAQAKMNISIHQKRAGRGLEVRGTQRRDGHNGRRQSHQR